MTSRGRKLKKKNENKGKTKEDIDKSNTTRHVTKHVCLTNYFTNEEIGQIKSVLKVKDVTRLSPVLAATILNKQELIEHMLEDGYDIDETDGRNQTSPLMLAIKCKYTELAAFLALKGANTTLMQDNGALPLVTALENKLWEEQSFMKLWHAVNSATTIDINYVDKNGHTMLHRAIRRDWETFVNILLQKKPNVNVANTNGITPLMLASLRNKPLIVEKLLNYGADVTREDNHRRTTVCYAIKTVMKVSRSSSPLTEKLVSELKKRSLFAKYLKDRLEIINLLAKKPEIPDTMSEMLIFVIQYIVQLTEDGIRTLLDLQIFQELEKALKCSVASTCKSKFILTILTEVLFYNEQSVGFIIELYNKMMKSFFMTQVLKLTLDILKSESESTSTLALSTILLTATSTDNGKKILKENYKDLSKYFENILTNFSNVFLEFPEERIKIIKRRLKKFKRVFNIIETQIYNPINVKLDQRSSSETVSDKKHDLATNSRTLKRRSRALKVKIAKLKNAELSERVNSTQKKYSDHRIESSATNDEKIELAEQIQVTDTDSNVKIQSESLSEKMFAEENPIVASFKYLIEQANLMLTDSVTLPSDFHDWKSHIASLPFDDNTWQGKNLNVDTEKLQDAFDIMRNISNGTRKCNYGTIGDVMKVIINYFNVLMEAIIKKYEKHFENDHRNEFYPFTDESSKENSITEDNKESKMSHLKDAQKNFQDLMTTIKSIPLKCPKECYKFICKIESILLHHEIRGSTLLPLLSTLEQIKLHHIVPSCSSLSLDVDPYNNRLLTTYMEGVLNGHIEQQEDIKIKLVANMDEKVYMKYKTETPNELYCKEMSLLSKPKQRDKRKELESKQKTLDYAYHLEESILKLCDSDDESKNESNHINKPDTSHTNPIPENSEIIVKALTKHVTSTSVTEDQNVPTKFSKSIVGLKLMENPLKLLNGEVRISCKEQRINYIISKGGNFNPVELGLDINSTPLAVKRIPKKSSVCKTMKDLIKQLLSLRHPHILHYFCCNYDKDELILITPLCEWNISQYLLITRQMVKSNLVNLSTMDIARQFLSGLMFLHNQKRPIVHGNMKPSNIFVDLYGVVRLAEFGIHQALFKIIEAPDTSLIWFAPETYRAYKQTSVMECTILSDIQVAGMLLHFILTTGSHPFGDGMYEILKNLEKYILKLSTQDLLLKELVVWMMNYDANERPMIEHVVSHVLFWSTSRKWKFILTCAGITHKGTPLPIDVSELHSMIDETRKRENKKDIWIEEIKKKHPGLQTANEDTLTGLLRFIKNFYDRQTMNEMSLDLCNCILTLFPLLPLTLQTILENTDWAQHSVFASFNLVDPIY